MGAPDLRKAGSEALQPKRPGSPDPFPATVWTRIDTVSGNRVPNRLGLELSLRTVVPSPWVNPPGARKTSPGSTWKPAWFALG